MLLQELMLSEKLLMLEEKMGGEEVDAIGFDAASGVLKLISCFEPPILGGGLQRAEGMEQLAGGVPVFLIDSLFFTIVYYFCILVECGQLIGVVSKCCQSSVFHRMLFVSQAFCEQSL